MLLYETFDLFVTMSFYFIPIYSEWKQRYKATSIVNVFLSVIVLKCLSACDDSFLWKLKEISLILSCSEKIKLK